MTGNFTVDVNNPLFKQVEALGINWLRRRYGYGGVIDTRGLKTFYDALVYPGSKHLRKLDFKADQQFARTNRVAWERALRYPDGSEKDGWGQKALDLVFYIDPVTFYGLLVDANAQRRLARLVLEEGLPEGWLSFSKLNPGRYAGEGLAIPIADLEREEAILWAGVVHDGAVLR